MGTVVRARPRSRNRLVWSTSVGSRGHTSLVSFSHIFCCSSSRNSLKSMNPSLFSLLSTDAIIALTSSLRGSKPSARSTTLSAVASITPCPSASKRSKACRISLRCCSLSISLPRAACACKSWATREWAFRSGSQIGKREESDHSFTNGRALLRAHSEVHYKVAGCREKRPRRIIRQRPRVIRQRTRTREKTI